MSTQFFAEKVFTGKELLFNQIIVVENGRIQSVESGTPKTGMPQVTNLAPGLFDSHINGGEQFYFTERADEETIDDIYQASVRTGTAYVLPTLITSPHENILKGIEATRSYLAQNPDSGGNLYRYRGRYFKACAGPRARHNGAPGRSSKRQRRQRDHWREPPSPPALHGR